MYLLRSKRQSDDVISHGNKVMIANKVVIVVVLCFWIFPNFILVYYICRVELRIFSPRILNVLANCVKTLKIQVKINA